MMKVYCTLKHYLMWMCRLMYLIEHFLHAFSSVGVQLLCGDCLGSDKNLAFPYHLYSPLSNILLFSFPSQFIDMSSKRCLYQNFSCHLELFCHGVFQIGLFAYTIGPDLDFVAVKLEKINHLVCLFRV